VPSPFGLMGTTRRLANCSDWWAGRAPTQPESARFNSRNCLARSYSRHGSVLATAGQHEAAVQLATWVPGQVGDPASP
jgi:uncharacterized Zn finger protein